MEAKVADLVANGLSLDEAVKKAKANLPSIDSIGHSCLRQRSIFVVIYGFQRQ
ncbi:hypothetical protein [Brevibacillus formosus]|uniref:hypothetical protein n=1 Tax=Brevibacillus formosus TaxID=54913 RepID=UPI003F1C928B